MDALFKCPNCGSAKYLEVLVEGWADLHLLEDGSQDIDPIPIVDFDGNAGMVCKLCQHSGVAKEFITDEIEEG